jgi:hypothetical protein
VPFGGGIGKIFKLGKLPLNGDIQGFYNVRSNDETIARWQLRVQLAFLFPAGGAKKKKPEEKPDSETARAVPVAPSGATVPPATLPAASTGVSVGERR